MHQQAGADVEVMKILEHAVDDERAVLHHRLREAAAALAPRCNHDPDLNRLGAQRKKFQSLGAEPRAPLSGDSRRDVGRQPAQQPSGENFEPVRVLARGIRGGRVRLCFAGQRGPRKVQIAGTGTGPGWGL